MNNRVLVAMIIILCLFILGCKQSGEALIQPDDNQGTVDLNKINTRVVQTNNDFGWQLFKTINTGCPDSNIFISPLSVSIALGMAINGANGTTRDEIVAMLNLDNLTEETINTTYQQLITLLSSNKQEVLFEIANSIWYDPNRMVPLQEFLTINQQYFFADVLDINFSQTDAVDIINDWISDKTHGKIENMLDHIPGSALLYLINALYFKGQWLYTFDPEKTREKDFFLLNGSRVQCLQMSHKTKHFYYADDQIQMVDLRYADTDYSMTLVVPTSSLDINSTIGALSPEAWSRWIGQLTEDSVSVILPKFKTEYKRLLNDDLGALGMQRAFNPGADFRRITAANDIWISRVLHKAMIEVNVEGSEAAAATIIEFVKGPGPAHPLIYLNRPFLFVIREHKTNTILFIGKIVNPIE